MIIVLRNENAPMRQIVSIVTPHLGGSNNVTFLPKDASNFGKVYEKFVKK